MTAAHDVRKLRGKRSEPPPGLRHDQRLPIFADIPRLIERLNTEARRKMITRVTCVSLFRHAMPRRYDGRTLQFRTVKHGPRIPDDWQFILQAR